MSALKVQTVPAGQACLNIIPIASGPPVSMSQGNSVVEDIRPNQQVVGTNGASSQALDDWVLEALDGLDDANDLPTSLIATNLDARVFTDSSFKVSLII